MKVARTALLALSALLLTSALAAAQASQSLPTQAPAEAALSAVPALRVVRPSVAVPGTPAELNVSVTVRYGPAQPRAVLLLMPGFLGGAGSFDRLARQIVALDPTVAVWAVDRRSNLLEPQAEVARADRAELERIVREGLPVRSPASVAFMKEWGLDVTLSDWRAAVLEARALTPNVIIGGHSMGGSLTALYAAYDFAGVRGADEVRGLVLLDGVPRAVPGQAITPERYQRGSVGVLGAQPGLNTLARNPYVSSAYFSPKLASRGAAQARLAALYPDDAAPQGGLSPFPATNLAAGLLQLEQRYALLPFLTVKTGSPVGALEAPSLLAMALGNRSGQWLTGPATPGQPVGWNSPPDSVTDARDFVGRFWNPVSDYTEWYFPNRLLLDLGAARTGTRGTPFESSLRVWHTASLALPVLGIAAQEGITKEADYRDYAGQSKANLTVHTLPAASHLDITAARSDQVARWVLEWMAGALR